MSAFSLFASLHEDHFRCLICQEVFTEPVTTPCGHNFCRTCLSQHWSDSEFYLCPTCNKRFHIRPEFSTNEVIAEISVQIKRRRIEVLESTDGPWRVKCDLCTGEFKAFMSCLVCMTSFCEAHLEPHQRVPSLMRHKLVEPVENLEERVCEKHTRILEFFCRCDEVCICLLCCETEHKDHETVPIEEEAARQKENIESNQAKIKLMIDERTDKIKEFMDSSEMRKVKVEKEIEDSEKLFNELMENIQEIQSKLKSNIDMKLRKCQEQDQAMIQKLEEEITSLQRKHSELEELSQNDDHLQLLQTLQALNTISITQDWSRIGAYSDMCMQTVRRVVSHLVTTFQMKLKTLTDTELTRMRQYKESVTFSESDAGDHLFISESGTRMKYSNKAKSLTSSDGPQRFYFPMTLGTKGFTSGRHYWEVQVGMRNDWNVGVALETVDRSNKVAVKTENGLFSIAKMKYDYYAYETPRKVLHLCPRPRQIGVYLDYEEGRVSFYDVDEKLHIQSFTRVRFTGKVFPYFYVYGGGKRSEPLRIVTIYDKEPYLALFYSLKQAENKTDSNDLMLGQTTSK